MSEPAEAGHLAYVALGSNLGERADYLRSALNAMGGRVGPVRAVSSAYETEPVGITDQPLFLNAVCSVETGLEPERLLETLLEIESEQGRVRTVKDGPRTLDLDLLLYEDLVIDEPGLQVPHPRMGERAFVLVPLAEIAPELIHPVSRLMVREMLARLPTPVGIGAKIRLPG
jgi:2-amino-4-hydroxy-6-hydroxymethyldihydropteridine diphosphokinase